MRIGERIAERRKAKGLSQGALAKRSGLSQPTIGKLEAGISSGSSHIHRIARSLDTTPAYLTGETDNPDENAPPPPPAPIIHHVMMAVALPSEAALARMFLGLLKTSKSAQSMDEQALLLAKRLPNALSQLRDMIPDTGPTALPTAERPAALATPGLEHQQ